MRARFVARAVVIGLLTGITLVRFVIGWLLLLMMFQPAAQRQAWAGRCLAGLLRKLGATFVKLGQILSTRADLLPPPLIAELETLQDDVGPFDFSYVRASIEQDFEEPLETLFPEFDIVPLASASVAQVHRAVLPSGQKVAVKVRRPDIERLVEFDLGALRVAGRMLELLPSMATLSPLSSIEEFGRGIRMQLDFTIEAANNRRFRTNFAGDAEVVFPELVEALCSHRVLTMELIDGEKILDHARIGADGKKLAAVGFRVLLKMIFEDGFVHADLHPGNLFVTRDQKLALLDLGLVGELRGEHRIGLAQYFAAFARGDGATMARLMTDLAPIAGAATTEQSNPRDQAAFAKSVSEFVARYHGRPLGELQISVVFVDMMDILRRHRIKANATFTLVNIAIMVTEGIAKQLDPSVDLMASAAPYFVHMGFTGPPAA